jgi:hypothetical protein
MKHCLRAGGNRARHEAQFYEWFHTDGQRAVNNLIGIEK